MHPLVQKLREELHEAIEIPISKIDPRYLGRIKDKRGNRTITLKEFNELEERHSNECQQSVLDEYHQNQRIEKYAETVPEENWECELNIPYENPPDDVWKRQLEFLQILAGDEPLKEFVERL